MFVLLKKAFLFIKETLFYFNSKSNKTIMADIKFDYLIAGLGNPGSKYENNRHNIGWMVVDKLVERMNLTWDLNTNIYYGASKKFAGKNVFICKPTTYMNNSGEAVRKICDKYHIPKKNVIIIVDEYNFEVGKIQVKRSGGAGGHNGTASVMDELGISDIVKMRCGIGKDFPPGGMVEYVLSDFTSDESDSLAGMIEKSCDALEAIIKHGDKNAASMINSGQLWNETAPKKALQKHNLKKVTVYAASARNIDEKYITDVRKLGKLLAENKIEIMFGGGKVGLMGALADAAIEKKGSVRGIIPEFMIEREWGHDKVTELKIVSSMHERKAELILNTDAVIALPGGCGTLEELLEVITLKRLGLFTKAIIIINTDGYYDPLIEMLNKTVTEKFMDEQSSKMWVVVDKPEEFFAAVKRSEEENGKRNDIE